MINTLGTEPLEIRVFLKQKITIKHINRSKNVWRIVFLLPVKIVKGYFKPFNLFFVFLFDF